jgi:hypothetical protein
MLKKGSLYFADWRDENGHRHRKGYRTKAAAARIQRKMQRAAHEKKAHASGNSASSRRLGVRAANTATTITRRSRRRAKSGAS